MSIINSVLIFVILIFLDARPVNAENFSNCQLKQGSIATVESVSETGLISLDNGSQVLMLGVLTPNSPFVSKRRKPIPMAVPVQKALSKLLQGQRVLLAFDSRREDRYGRLLAHIYLIGTSKRIWVQQYLVERGLARVYSFRENRSCVTNLLDFEKRARSGKLGLWHYRAYKIRAAGEPKRLLRYRNSFQIVEGAVARVAKVKGRIFINFGKDWRMDFTVTIAKNFVRELSNGEDFTKNLEGKRVRVRGWIEYWNGPIIRISHAEQLEIVEGPSLRHEVTPPKENDPAIGLPGHREI